MIWVCVCRSVRIHPLAWRCRFSKQRPARPGHGLRPSQTRFGEGDRLAGVIEDELSSDLAAGWESVSSERGGLCYESGVDSEEGVGASGITSDVGSPRCAVSRWLGAALRPQAPARYQFSTSWDVHGPRDTAARFEPGAVAPYAYPQRNRRQNAASSLARVAPQPPSRLGSPWAGAESPL